MGLFKKNAIKEVKSCIVEESMWNVFNKMPWRAVDLRQGWQHTRWTKLDVPLVELVWMALDEASEEKYLQYAWLFKDGAEIMDGFSRLFIFIEDGFVYNGMKCKHVVVPSWRCDEFGCKALMLRSPRDAFNRLQYLYNTWLKRKAKTKQK